MSFISLGGPAGVSAGGGDGKCLRFLGGGGGGGGSSSRLSFGPTACVLLVDGPGKSSLICIASTARSSSGTNPLSNLLILATSGLSIRT